MPQTSDAYFLSAAQAAPGTVAWSNLSNLLALAGEATTTGMSGTISTQTVSLNDPANAGEMGPNDEITDIRIQVRGYFEGGLSAEVSLVNLQIAGGSTKSDVMVKDTPTTYIFDGDLAYWGITSQQARDFVDGTEDLDFQAQHIAGSNSTKEAVVWVEVRFDFIEVSLLVNLPSIF